MVIDGPDPFAAKPDARLIRLLLRARRFNATLAQSEGVPFAALAEREGVRRDDDIRGIRFAHDSLLEGDGFELPVPREKSTRFFN